MREREKRRKVLLRVRMRSDAGWSDVVVRNISRRGMQICADRPIPPGSYIEIRRAHYTIVARIVWSANERLGARSQDPIDVEGLIAAAAAEHEPGGGKAGGAGQRSGPASPTPERRAADRRAAGRSIADGAQRSRYLSSRLQFVALALAVATAAAAIASQVNDRLAGPFDRVRIALATAG